MMLSGASFTVERSKYYEAEFSFDKFEAVTTGGSALLPSGKDFFFSKNPTNFSGGTSDTVENATASVPGKLDIYCTPETANWIKGTLFRKVNNGGYTGVPYPITFFDLTSGSTISVDWPE